MNFVARIMAVLCFVVSITACQKGIEWPDGVVSIPIGTDTTGMGNTDTTTGNINGDLLVKGVQVSSNGDTNIVALAYDANKKLITYKSSGKSNGQFVDATYYITRLANGNLATIKYIPFTIITGIDSIVYHVSYLAGTSKLAYAISTKATIIGDLKDSITYLYNTAGNVSKKTIYSENFLTSAMDKSLEQTYVYDAAKNVTGITSTSYNPIDASLTSTSAATYTYDNHKSCLAMGDEAYVLDIFDASATSPKNIVGKSVAGMPTLSTTNLLFNASDRPYKGRITVTSTNITLVSNFSYYYQ